MSDYRKEFINEAFQNALDLRGHLAHSQNNVRSILKEKITIIVEQLENNPTDTNAKREFEFWTGFEADTDRTEKDYLDPVENFEE